MADAPNNKNYNFGAILKATPALNGHLTSFIADASGVVQMKAERSKLKPEDVVEAVFGVYGEGKNACSEMGLGGLEHVEVDGPWGTIYMNLLGDKVLVCVCDTGAKGETVQMQIGRILEKSAQ